MSAIDKEVSRIISSGALGRSPAYERLLRYLAQCDSEARNPREVDIADDVFGRSDFDPAGDSSVRVYLHNLRQKLDAYYANHDASARQRLAIPKGQYRLSFVATPKSDSKPASHRLILLSGAVGLVLAAILAAFFVGRTSVDAPPRDVLAQSRLWSPILDDDIPITVVVGDYYVFAETNQFGMLDRLIRDFGINNKDDFDSYLDEDPLRADRYQDVRLTYLPTGVGAALGDFLKVPYGARKAVNVIPQSDFTAPVMRANHVIYIGYLSGLDELTQYAFGESRLELGASYDELIDVESGEKYTSHAGFITESDISYADFGFFSSFPGPAGNQFMFIIGMRDEGLMQMAATLTDADRVEQLVTALPHEMAGAAGIEALYKVSSLDRTHLSAELLFAEAFDASMLWRN